MGLLKPGLNPELPPNYLVQPVITFLWEPEDILYFAVYNTHPCFWTKLSGKKYFVLIFNSVTYLFIYI